MFMFSLSIFHSPSPQIGNHNHLSSSFVLHGMVNIHTYYICMYITIYLSVQYNINFGIILAMQVFFPSRSCLFNSSRNFRMQPQPLQSFVPAMAALPHSSYSTAFVIQQQQHQQIPNNYVSPNGHFVPMPIDYQQLQHFGPPTGLEFAHHSQLKPPPVAEIQYVQVMPNMVGTGNANGRMARDLDQQQQQHVAATTATATTSYLANRPQAFPTRTMVNTGTTPHQQTAGRQHHLFRPQTLLPISVPPPPLVTFSHPNPFAIAAAHAHPSPQQAALIPHPPVVANKGGPTKHSAAENAAPSAAVAAGTAAGGDCWSTAVTGWEQAAMIKNKIGLVIKGRFQIVQSIASGSYGDIFAADDLHTPGPKRQRVAVKFDGACRDNHLRYEYDVYKSVLYEDGQGRVEGFPQVYWYDHEYGHNIMVMELLGPPVASLFAFCDRKFARPTIVSLGEQMIQRIRHLHQRGFIHRDIKPENFLMGLPPGRESTLYLIDFGLARRYRYREGENRTLTHIPYRRGRSFIGTAKYASLNSHKNIELSRRDDLESLAYVLIELINGHLPWKNIQKRNATTRHMASQRIRQLKEQTNWEEYCPPMARFIRYCREIPFNDEPDYDKLLDMLQLVAQHGQPLLLIHHRLPNAAVHCSSYKNNTVAMASMAVCCQTPEKVEQAIQVDLLERNVRGQETEEQPKGGKKGIYSPSPDQQPQQIEQQLSLTTGENASDFDEIGAATTTTSCSENEMDMVGGEVAGGVMTRSGTGTADDEDSQPMPLQEQQPLACRKCRRLRDQTQQQQQKKAKDSHFRHQQKIVESVDQGLQTEQPRPSKPIATGIGNEHKPELKKMCWQKARESNPERRFQYENKFSWALPIPMELMHPKQMDIAFLPHPAAFPAGQPLPLTIPQNQMAPHHLIQQYNGTQNKCQANQPLHQQRNQPPATSLVQFATDQYNNHFYSLAPPAFPCHLPSATTSAFPAPTTMQPFLLKAAPAQQQDHQRGFVAKRPLQVAFVVPPPINFNTK